ncbi:MAG: hypothetical protein Fur003_2580 [Candidatus Dojkabacteria bacterium]
MEHLIKASRIRQRRRYLIQVIILGIVLISLLLAGLYYLFTNNSEFKPSASKNAKPIINICYSELLPTDLKEAITSAGYANYKSENQIKFNTSGSCTVEIARNPANTNEYKEVTSRIYVAIARFDLLIEDLTKEDLANALQIQSYNQYSIIWEASETNSFIKSRFNTTLGQQYTDIAAVLSAIKSNSKAIAIIPFEYLTPAVKTLSIDEETPLHPESMTSAYPLTDTIWIKGTNSKLVKELTLILQNSTFQPNYDKTALQTVLLSGQSWIGAGGYIAKNASQKDIYYPYRGLEALFNSATISHLSNGTSFSSECAQTTTSQVKCGTLDNIEVLKYLSPDLIGLTNDHLLDYSRPLFESTVKAFQTNSLKYYGAGLNQADANKVITLPIGEKKLGFVGYTLTLPYKYLAGKNYSGHAGSTSEQLAGLIKADAKNNDFLIVELQAGEVNSVKHNAEQASIAEKALQNDGNIVLFTRSTRPQGIQIDSNKVTFYSLGSIFTGVPDTEGLLVKNYFYKGEYLGFELLPVYTDVSLQTVLAEGNRKAKILQTVYSDSLIK